MLYDYEQNKAMWCVDQADRIFDDGLKSKETKKYMRMRGIEMKFYEAGNAYAVGMFHKGHIDVIFRGTDTDSDKIHLPLKEYLKFPIGYWEWTDPEHGNVRIHARFPEHLDLIWNDLRDDIVKHVREETKDWTRDRKGLHGWPVRITLTGHSLGGSLALLTTHRLSHLLCDPTDGKEGECGYNIPEDFYSLRTYTFGAPQTGNKAFNRRLAERAHVYRFVHGNDIVPRLGIPFLSRASSDTGAKSKGAGRDHYVFLPRAGGPSKHNPAFPVGLWERLLHNWLILPFRYGWNGFLTDHYPWKYKKAVSKYATQS